MSYDTNWIKPTYNGLDRHLEPLPELESDDVYIAKRKAREDELWLDGSVIKDAVERNLSVNFIGSIQLHRHAKEDGFPENAEFNRKAAIEQLVEDIEAYIQELAREDVDNE